MEILQKTRTKTIICDSSLATGGKPQFTQTNYVRKPQFKRHMHPSFHCSKSQDMEAT